MRRPSLLTLSGQPGDSVLCSLQVALVVGAQVLGDALHRVIGERTHRRAPQQVLCGRVGCQVVREPVVAKFLLKLKFLTQTTLFLLFFLNKSVKNKLEVLRLNNSLSCKKKLFYYFLIEGINIPNMKLPAVAKS